MGGRSEAIIRRAFELAANGQLEEAAAFYHPDAIAVPLLNPDTALSGTAIPEYARQQSRAATFHEGTAHRIQAVDDDRFIVEGRVRWSMPTGGFLDSQAVWAFVMKDGKIYRAKGVADVASAMATLRDDDWSPGKLLDEVS